jgi:hypothetical protein
MKLRKNCQKGSKKLSKKKQKPAVAANKMRRSYFKPGN